MEAASATSEGVVQSSLSMLHGTSEASQMPALSRTVTESSGSTYTVRGDRNFKADAEPLSSPTYPPPLTASGLGTPLATPGAHLPFTALSPTTVPNTAASAKFAKGDIAKEFMASGGVSQYRERTTATTNFGPLSEAVLNGKPNLFEIAVRIQTDPGLGGWWKQTIQVLQETFQAERASLAVPSDSTEVENVPWAQLASFNIDHDDGASQVAPDTESARSGLSEILAQDVSLGEKQQEKETSTSLRSSPYSDSFSLAARPKLESRHSYAGYPIKHQAIHPEVTPHATSLKRPRPSRTGSQASIGVTRARGIAEVKSEQIRRWDSETSQGGPLSDDTSPSNSGQGGRILDILQPLDAETDALITPAGIVKVLNNSRATVLTRKYIGPGGVTRPIATAARATSLAKTTNLSKQAPSDAAPGPKVAARQRSSTGSNSSMAFYGYDQRDQAQGQSSLYEDFEQVPGTPWAQSPAPSPAAATDPDENPFFAETSMVKEAFRKDPPAHIYEDGRQIEAIGQDMSSTIIQIPLIHPNTSLSRPQRAHHLREDRRKKDGKTFRVTAGRQPSAERKRKVPLAILSILVPVIPYPIELVEALNQLSPLLATSFYAARQHSNLQNEVFGLSQRRARSGGRPFVREEKPPEYGGIRAFSGFNPVSSVQEESFSPISTGSAASSSEYGLTPLLGPRTHSGLAEDKAGQPGLEASSESDKDMRQKRSDNIERSDGYFPSQLSQEISQEKSPPKRQPHLKVSAHAQRVATQKKPQVLHSLGATFHNTHPSLPTATTEPKLEGEAAEVGEQEGQPFKEPSLSLLRSMIDIGATQHFIAEPDSGKLLWVNSKFQAYRSGSSGLRLDDQLWDKIYYKDRKPFRREWTSALETGEQLSQQLRLERFDGQYRWFHIKFLPLKDRFGLIKYWSGQAMDIHDLHEAEVKAAKSKERAASEAKYRAIANSLPVIVFAASVPNGMTFANTQWLSYSGQSLKEALGFGFLNHVHPEDLTKCRFPGLGDTALLSPKSPTALTKQRAKVFRSDSTTSSAAESESTAVPESAIKGRASHSTSPSEELHIPNELLRGLAKDGVILCAKDGQGNLSITTEMRLKSKDGDYRWHLVQGSFIESVDFGQGEAQWFIACTDISVQKKNEAKIQGTNSALEHMNSALEAEMQRKMGYLSSMSHEIRTPLNGILGNLQFLINSGLGESAGEWAHGAQEAAKTMHDLLNNILDLSKAEAKMLKLDTHWFDPRNVMEDVLDLLNSKTTEKKIELCHECAPNVPKSIRGDQGRIKQVLLNLAGNSIKFTKVGEVIIKCDILDELPPDVEQPELHDNEMFIRWTINDTGIGFSEADEKLLFKAYSQVKSKDTRDIVGTGLGLLICRTLVNLHGGEIAATSGGPGKGASFSFFARFKVRKESAAQSQSTSSVSSPVPSGPGPVSATAALSFSRHTESPAPLHAQAPAGDSPALLSDSSSAPSFHSSMRHGSIRSSASTQDSSVSDSPMKLSLPPRDGSFPRPASGEMRSPTSPPVHGRLTPSKRTSAILTLPKAGPLSPKSASVSAKALKSSSGLHQRTSSSFSRNGTPAKAESDIDHERSSFRPPMLSVLVICPPKDTRRITCNRIQYVAPKSTPCNITSEASVDAAMDLLLGEEPILFTHIVVRIVEDDVVASCLMKLLDSPRHAQACIVIITDQGQAGAIKASIPDVDFDALSRSDRVKMPFKPAHPHKLGKIFDPFNENATIIEDPKEAKRREEKRLQKESYALFQRILGGKGIRVLAVEDNRLQMNVSLSSCSCCLPVSH